MAYIANTPEDTAVMLGTIGIDSLDQLFDMVPPEFRLKRDLDVGPALSELELTNHIGSLLAKNQGADHRVCFLGGGSYDHFIPAVVDHLASRGEFYTAYTPYQPEASQGTLQATFEYQTLVTQLTGMDVSNASLYDGGSAVGRGGAHGADRSPGGSAALSFPKRFIPNTGRSWGPRWSIWSRSWSPSRRHGGPSMPRASPRPSLTTPPPSFCSTPISSDS